MIYEIEVEFKQWNLIEFLLHFGIDINLTNDKCIAH